MTVFVRTSYDGPVYPTMKDYAAMVTATIRVMCETVLAMGMVYVVSFAGVVVVGCIGMSQIPWSILRVLVLLVGGLAVLLMAYWRYNFARLSKLPGKLEPVSKSFEERNIRMRVLNLDGAMLRQSSLLEKYRAKVYDVSEVGPHVRMGCGYEHYKWLESRMTKSFGCEIDGKDRECLVTFYGSNDFHHVALALIRRIRQPVNMVLFDTHPDWLVNPFGQHCGSWYNLVMDLPTVQQGFHFGACSGEFEDEVLMHVSPWNHIESGKLRVFPTSNMLQAGRWQNVETPTLRPPGCTRNLTIERARVLLKPYREVLASFPLYITLDKDCMGRWYCLQNWNSGDLTLTEVCIIIEVLVEYAEGRLLGIDVTGDWSGVDVRGWMREILHEQQHDEEQNKIDCKIADAVNERTNLLL
eukprot:CAMPEP_0119121856 /NCGR_PEP_ID=MMETSP1310-20130426/2289_1 /TAXON_ID=464262 /ORGANISM="Genus nov. species nov., Strain RCC2339" /LENGTH=410 /DNA_ID=CAMNT_0007111437 /DNA_START=37 /DNA_END=1265 /DNA_ORIENTATION=+